MFLEQNVSSYSAWAHRCAHSSQRQFCMEKERKRSQEWICSRVTGHFRARMASVGSMQFKQLLAASLSLLLLSVSSWASVCELSCSLSHADPVSKPTGSSTAKQAHEVGRSEMNAAHSHCGHAKAFRPTGGSNHSFENASSCMNASCAQAQTLSSPVNGRDITKHHGLRLAVLVSVPAPPSNDLFGSPKCECALTKFLPLGLLSVGLRI